MPFFHGILVDWISACESIDWIFPEVRDFFFSLFFRIKRIYVCDNDFVRRDYIYYRKIILSHTILDTLTGNERARCHFILVLSMARSHAYKFEFKFYQFNESIITLHAPMQQPPEWWFRCAHTHTHTFWFRIISCGQFSYELYNTLQFRCVENICICLSLVATSIINSWNACYCWLYLLYSTLSIPW